MRPGDHHPVPTVSEVVERATALVDPDGHVTAVGALYEGFEDDDRPATAAEDLGAELDETVDAIDPDDYTPAARVAVAAAVWLATNWDRDHDRGHVVREGVRLHFHGDPPGPVRDWLEEQRISA